MDACLHETDIKDMAYPQHMYRGEFGPYLFTASLTLMWDWGGAKGFDVG